MTFKSILNISENNLPDPEYRIFYTDFNLDQIIDRICADWPDIKKEFYRFPVDKDCESYRREVLNDMKNSNIRELFITFLREMKEWEKAKETKESVAEDAQRNTWLLMETGHYIDSLEHLYNNLSAHVLSSRGLKAFLTFLEEYLNSAPYLDMKQEMNRIRTTLKDMRFRITYDKDRFIISEEEQRANYSGYLNKVFPTNTGEFKNPFSGNPNWKELEYEIYILIKKKYPDIFKDINSFYKKHKDYCLSEVILFKKEISYYLAFLEFRDKMTDGNFNFTAPDCDEEAPIFADGLYDLALACNYMYEDKEVVANDMALHPGESFIVVTGPNQGGKTTFARSLGQLVYFCKMGLDVPAKKCNMHYFKNILSHFSVEESIESGKGKLKEELVRLKPMMKENCDNAFVVINELFTTAANYDACIMGINVIKHFLEHNCCGIYVTHLYELASVDNKIVSMKAMLNENNKQTFHIERSEAVEYAFADNQVNKYQLRYEQIVKRFQEREQ